MFLNNIYFNGKLVSRFLTIKECFDPLSKDTKYKDVQQFLIETKNLAMLDNHVFENDNKIIRFKTDVNPENKLLTCSENITLNRMLLDADDLGIIEWIELLLGINNITYTY